MRRKESMSEMGCAYVFCAAAIFPAVALGVFAMIADGVSPVLWGQQIAAFAVFALLGLLRRSAQKIPSAVWAAVCLLALSATLLFPGAGGARRWLDLGLLNVNAAMLVLPALLTGLGGMTCFYPMLLCAAAVLCAQPDLSQLTALFAASLSLLWRGRKARLWGALSVVVQLVLICICMNIPTAIEPTSYSENILLMLGDHSSLLMAAGVLALAMIPGFWAYRFLKAGDVRMLSLAVYEAAVILFGLSGEYPMPFMGFGLSPIAGYFLFCLLLPETSESTQVE